MTTPELKRYTMTCDEGEVRLYAPDMATALPESKRIAAAAGWRWRATVSDGPGLHEDIDRLRRALDVLLSRRDLLSIKSDIGNMLEAALTPIVQAWVRSAAKTCDTCADAPICEFAGDDYNTDGDCLASK